MNAVAAGAPRQDQQNDTQTNMRWQAKLRTRAERFIKEPTALALNLFIEEAILTLNVFAELRLSYGHYRDGHILGR